MSRSNVTKCDNCGAEKKATNHWWQVAVENNIITGGNNLVIYPFGLRLAPTMVNPIEDMDACGQACATECVSRFLSTGKIART